MKIGFLTGARSEYGVMRQLIQRVSEDSFFTLVIYATGMHFQQKYGLTINELKADNFGLIVEMPCYTEEQRDKKDDFVALIDVISAGLISNRPDILYLIGDRLEAYAGALPAHFQNSFTTNHMLHKVPITIPITPNMYRTFCSVCFENVIRVMTVAPATIPRAKPILTAIPLTIIVNIILIKSILF